MEIKKLLKSESEQFRYYDIQDISNKETYHLAIPLCENSMLSQVRIAGAMGNWLLEHQNIKEGESFILIRRGFVDDRIYHIPDHKDLMMEYMFN